MSKLEWDKVGEKTYETGVDRGVLYPVTTEGAYSAGVSWNGLTTVDEKPTGAEANKLYADNIAYLELTGVEEFEATINAYTYPDEFAVCDGTAEVEPGVFASQQPRRPFGFSYRTLIGNDSEGEDYGYIIHLVYGAKAAPSEKSRQTINDNPEAVEFSWDVTTTPVTVAKINSVTGKPYKPMAHIAINSTKVDKAKLEEFENILYGTNGEGQTTGTDARLPLPDEVFTLFK